MENSRPYDDVTYLPRFAFFWYQSMAATWSPICFAFSVNLDLLAWRGNCLIMDISLRQTVLKLFFFICSSFIIFATADDLGFCSDPFCKGIKESFKVC